MRRRLVWIVLGAFFLLAGLAALFVFYPRPASPFPFLDDKPIAAGPFPANVGTFGPEYGVVYAFKGDWAKFMAEVNRALPEPEWMVVTFDGDWNSLKTGDPKGQIVQYIKDRQFLYFFRDAKPLSKGPDEMYGGKDSEKGSIEVVYSDRNHRPSLSERVRDWFRRVFGQKDPSQNE